MFTCIFLAVVCSQPPMSLVSFVEIETVVKDFPEYFTNQQVKEFAFTVAGRDSTKQNLIADLERKVGNAVFVKVRLVYKARYGLPGLSDVQLQHYLELDTDQISFVEELIGQLNQDTTKLFSAVAKSGDSMAVKATLEQSRKLQNSYSQKLSGRLSEKQC
jgi:hypothetical protein